MNEGAAETEIKLPFPSATEAIERLGKLGATILHERAFEDNVAFDLPSKELTSTGRLLRVRRYGKRAWLAYKGPRTGLGPHKSRTEHETLIENPEAVERLLAELGFEPVYRYEKYRTIFALPGIEVSVDETPLGCFVELEGEPSAIDAVARRLGFSPEDYIVATYRELQEEAARKAGRPAGDLLFESDRSAPR
jgi:adenylate cyclase class 2